MEKNFQELLIKEAKKNDIKISSQSAQEFYKYMNLLLEWNKKINLTAITEINDIILKHFVDSLTVLKYINKANTIVDIGTGAGFPGIPLAIMEKQKRFTLVDSLNKRINFINIVKEELKLENIELVHMRAEDFGQNNVYRERFDIAMSRAVANLSVLVEYLLPTVKCGGQVICMKGSQVEEEIKQAEFAIKELGGKIKEVNEFTLVNTDIKRNIVIIEKIRNTPQKYPRKAGLPSKQPLI